MGDERALLQPRLAWLTGALALLSASSATAQVCGADVSCGPGYVCVTGQWLQCTGCEPTWPWPAFDGGTGDAGSAPLPGPWTDAGVIAAAEDAGLVDAGSCEQSCVPVDYHYCEAAPCSADADCPGTMVCHTESYDECSESACMPGIECKGDAGYSCTEHTRSTCAERHNLPCGVDEDCGPGFECNREPYQSCMGGGGIETGPDGGWIFIDAGYECTTVTPETGWCSLERLPCESDSECPATMSCQTQYDYPPCFPPWDGAVVSVDAGPGNAAEGGTGRPPAPEAVLAEEKDAGAGGWVPWECPPPVLSHVCRPESWGSGGLIGGGFAGGGLTGGGGYPQDAGVSYDATAPSGGTQGGGGYAGGAPGGSVAGGALGGSPTGPGSGQGSGEVDEEEGHGEHSHRPLLKLLKTLLGSGGCSVAGEAAHGNLAWLSALSMFLVARVRRRRD